MTTQVVLGLGSNMPFADANGIIYSPDKVLEKACDVLKGFLQNAKTSSVYITKPMYCENQADFFNMVLVGDFCGTPRELLELVNKIEYDFARKRGSGVIDKGPRTLDIDIELFGNEIITEDNCEKPLFIPHALIKERQFVLVPLLEILPDSADPITGQSFSSILSKLSDQGVKLWK